MGTAKQILAGAELMQAVEKIEELRTVPTVLQKILSELMNPEANLEEIARLVMQDSVLSAKVLRLVNSPFIGLSREITSLKQAIVLLGMKRIRNLVLTTFMIQQFPLRDGELPAWHFWAHALGTAQCTTFLNIQSDGLPGELYYLAGLLHDIGEIVLAQYFPEEFSFVYQFARQSQIGLYKAEKEILDVTHCEIGETLAERWGFPEAVRSVIAFHHRPEHAQKDVPLVAAVHISNLFTKVYGLNYNIYEPTLLSVKDVPSFKILSSHSPQAMERDWETFSLELMDRFQKISVSVKHMFEES